MFQAKRVPASLFAGKRVVVHSDNTGSEVDLCCRCARDQTITAHWQVSVRRGTARSWDHAQLVHEQLLHAVQIGARLLVKRVATDDNIADLPSREARSMPLSQRFMRASLWQDFHLLHAIGAQKVAPVLHERFLDEVAWKVLFERWGCVPSVATSA